MRFESRLRVDMASHGLRTFFITEVASGLGHAIARAALGTGHRVVGTLGDEAACAAFEGLALGRSFGRVRSPTDADAVAPLIDEIERTIGAIDVAIHHCGTSHEGLLEESTLDEARRHFDAEVFGAIALMKGVLPHMRARRAGHILNITSMGGFVTFPGLGVLHGSKFALEGISEAVGQEVAAFGIRVIAVAPGNFGADAAEAQSVHAQRRIADYDAILDPVCTARDRRARGPVGDPERAARAVLAVLESPDPPAHLLLGSDAVAAVRAKLEGLGAEISRWEALSRSADPCKD